LLLTGIRHDPTLIRESCHNVAARPATKKRMPIATTISASRRRMSFSGQDADLKWQQRHRAGDPAGVVTTAMANAATRATTSTQTPASTRQI